LSTKKMLVIRRRMGKSVIHALYRTLLRKDTIFSRSFIKKGKLEEFPNVTPYDVLAFRPLDEVTGLSRHFP